MALTTLNTVSLETDYPSFNKMKKLLVMEARENTTMMLKIRLSASQPQDIDYGHNSDELKEGQSMRTSKKHKEKTG